MFLRAADGKKFLVYLFGLHPPFIDAVHETIKAQIPACPKSLLESYGEVYFKAWKVAQGPYLLKLGITLLFCDITENASRLAFSFLPCLRAFLFAFFQSTHASKT